MRRFLKNEASAAVLRHVGKLSLETMLKVLQSALLEFDKLTGHAEAALSTGELQNYVKHLKDRAVLVRGLPQKLKFAANRKEDILPQFFENLIKEFSKRAAAAIEEGTIMGLASLLSSEVAGENNEFQELVDSIQRVLGDVS